MAKEKFQKFLLWLKDHFLVLLEVVVRLSIGLREENNSSHQNNQQTKESARKEKEL